VRAIETEYAGVRFRSRLEARWAVFFDALGVSWRYEHEGFELPSGRYLPDFWLPDVDVWVEIKGRKPTDDEERLCHELANAWEYRGPLDDGLLALDGFEEDAEGVRFFKGDIQYWPCVCPECGRVGIEFNGRGARVCGAAHSQMDDKAYSFDHPRILDAIDKVRAHRFWNPDPRACP
jgi:hypothetical protein